jgi:hypothetical protein
MSMHDVETQLGDYWAELVADYPVPSAVELMAPSVSSIDSAAHSVETEADRPRGDALMFDSHWHVDESTTPSERKRWIGALTAVAATILVVAGAVVVAERTSDDVVTDPASSPTVTGPAVSSPDVDDPVAVPSVIVPPVVGCEFPQGWAQVCDAETLGGGVMYAVTAGGPGLVAVGANHLDYYTRETQADLFGYGEQDDLIGAADAVVWTSPDGFTWSRAPHDETIFGGDGSQQMFDVTAGGPGLVAVGRDGPAVDGEGNAAVWTSPDGLTWSRVPDDEAVFGGPGEQRMVSVTVGGPGLVAVGFDRPAVDGEQNAAVWISADGLTWIRVPHDEAVFGGDSSQMMLSVTDQGPGLVAVGSVGHPDEEKDRRIDELAADAAVWTSADGLTWFRVPHDEEVFGGPGEQRMVSVSVGGPGLVAVGFVREKLVGFYELSDAAVWTSPDGLTWSRVPHDEAVFARSGDTGDKDEVMLSVTAGGPGLVAVGFDSVDDCGWDSAVWTSPDGLTWSRVPDERNCNAGPYDRMLSVTVGPSGLVAVGEEHSPSFAAAVWNR